jgi:YHS domain-containing protein
VIRVRRERYAGVNSTRRYTDFEVFMERDVVCGMSVDPAKAAATSEYNGKTYYFCAKVCKTKFDANPAQYVK